MSIWASLAVKKGSPRWWSPALISPMRPKHRSHAKSRNQLETRRAGRRHVAVLRAARGQTMAVLSTGKAVRPMAGHQKPAGGRLAGVAGLGAPQNYAAVAASRRGGPIDKNNLGAISGNRMLSRRQWFHEI